ncbi:MAG: T9SS type A sorting domain-containing protein [Bacteroidia bacterium]|nr:T9SS type A sorting domain-containing protein [Bacteroidia bacterium]
MKKKFQKIALASLIVAGCAIQAKAQSEVRAEGISGTEIVTDAQLEGNNKMKADYSNWKFPVDAIEQLTSLDRFVNFLFQDSTVQFVSDDGTARFNTWVSVGAAFTPNDENIELSDDNIKLSRYNEYTVDSLYFPYLYVRYVDSMDVAGSMTEVVDTLIVQFFKSGNLASGSFTPPGQETELYMKPDNWTTSLLGSNNTSYEIKIPLRGEDSTSRPSANGWGSRGRVVALPNGFDINSDAATEALAFTNAVGYSMTYKTMLDYEFGDTIEARNGAEITNKLNYFGHSMFINSSVEVKQTEYINNSWWVPNTIAAGENQNGWENSVAGNAYFDDRYVNYAFHISTTSLGTEELNNNVTFGVYPNPVSSTEILKADFNLVNGTDVTIEIYDLLGNKVKEVVNGYYAGGEHKVNVNITDLSAGMYVYSVKAGSSVVAKKITITD